MMKYLLDTNVLRHYTDGHQTLLNNLASVALEQVTVPSIVFAEQMRGRYDALLKAEPQNLMREQERLIGTQAVLSAFSILYLDQSSVDKLIELRQKHSSKKRYADVIMLALRKQTLRSHASITFKADGVGLPTNVTEIIETAASTIEATGKEWHKHFRDTAFGYLQDIRHSLARQYELLRPSGQAVCVVANSAHGSGSNRIPIAIDLLIARIAQNLGFEAQRLSIARQMRRRDSLNRYLRETVLVLRRPES